MPFREPILYMSSGQWRLDHEAWKRNLDFGLTSTLHRMSLRRVRRHLQDLAEAEAERVAASNTGPAGLDLVPQPDTAIVSSSDAPPAQRRVTPAIYAEGSRSMLHWDLVEYTWTLDNLTDDLVPAVRRSRRFAIVFVVAKAIESSLWTPAQHPRLAFALAMLASYHVIFALTYLSWLSIVSRSRRRAEDFRQKVISRTISHEDVDVWAGLPLRLTNWIADTRSARKRVYESTPQWWPWFLVEMLKLTIF